MKKYEWRYWFAGMAIPKTLPKGCEFYNGYKWVKCSSNMNLWKEFAFPRRWKVALKTCKWCESDVFGIINPHTGVRNEDEITYCPTCGKPVEIMKKGEK